MRSVTRSSSKSSASKAIEIQALGSGMVNAAVLDGIFSRRLKQKGSTILGEYSELKYQFISQAIVVQRQISSAARR